MVGIFLGFLGMVVKLGVVGLILLVFYFIVDGNYIFVFVIGVFFVIIVVVVIWVFILKVEFLKKKV